MSNLDTLLFAVGISIFMITVYGAVMAGGMTLQRRQRDELAADVEIVVNERGYDVLTSATSDRIDHRDD